MELFWTVVFGLVFFGLLMASVALHEVGHLVPAKLFGVRVPRYFVGFGHSLWSRRIGETEYGVKIFPLGGFVQLLGMYPPARPDARPTRLQRFADEVRGYEWEEIRPSDRGHLFFELPVWRKVVVMAGGITVNLLLAFLLTWGVLGLHGVRVPQPVVAAVQQCVIPADRDERTCQPGDRPTPAVQAGMQPGDRVVSFNGQPVTDHAQMTELIRANLDRPATLEVERGGARVVLPTVTPLVVDLADAGDPSRTTKAGWLGLVPTYERVHGGPVDALRQLGTQAAASVVALVQFPVKVWNVAVDVVTGQPRDVNDPISIVGASTIAGQAATTDATVADKAAMFASLLASVNLFLALFNLVPLPPLDGGHIVGALWEGLRRGLARLAGRPDPGHVDTAKMVPVAYAVGGFLLLCGLVLIVADIVAPVKIF